MDIRQSTGFIGLGNLGRPIAENLLEQGYALRLFNRTAEKAAALATRGGVVENSIAELASRCRVVISLVANDDALKKITAGEDGIAAHLGAGGIHISMSTVSPELAHELAALHQQQGSFYIAAPVMGRPEAARARKLSLCISGNADAKKQLTGLWEAAGAPQVYDFGERASAANVVKLAVNFMIGAQVEILSEAFAFTEKSGVSASVFFEMISGGLFNNPVVKNYGQLILQRKFEPPSFSLELGLKDFNLVLDTGGNRGVSMPVARVVKDRLQQSKAKGREALDWSAFSLISQEEAGLPGM